MQVRFTRQRLIEETALVEVSDDDLREADIDPDEVTDADIEDAMGYLPSRFEPVYDETVGWEDVDLKVEIESY